MPETTNEERFLNSEPYGIIDNPIIGHQWRFLERGSDADGEYLLTEIRYRPDANAPPLHVHPRQDKTFSVLSGELAVVTDGDERLLAAGEDVTIPAGVPHTTRNAGETEARVLYEVRPPLAQEQIMRTFFALARDGKTSADGLPHPLQLAVILDTYPGNFYAASPPVAVQKVLFKLLAPLGRLRGYKAVYPEAPESGSGAPRIES